MTSPNIVHGRLSLGSFIKLSVIAAIGLLPVLAVLFGLAFLIGFARSNHPTSQDDIIVALWPILLLKVIASAFSIVLSGFFTGLCGYPFYAWLCRRRSGIVLKGEFEVL